MDSGFADKIGEWLAPDGPNNDVVISSRIRLARNVRGFEMPWRLERGDRKKLGDMLRRRLVEDRPIGDIAFWDMESLTENERTLLVERHLISNELATGEGSRAVAFTPREDVSVMVLEEDHLRLQVLRCGLQIEEAWRDINAIDTALERTVPYAVSEDFGYLTACPTNVGTGMRVSVMTHLPTLVHTKQIKKVHTAAAKVGLVLRGFHGEGTRATGDFYQISNQVTLGRSEDDILHDVFTMVSKIVEWERGVRKLLLEQDRSAVEDRVWRAWGTLKFARKMASEEALDLLSSVRLGINTGILSDVRLRDLNEIMLYIQPAHLQTLRGALEPKRRDIVRASLIREWLQTNR